MSKKVLEGKKIAFIGAGNMAEAIIRGMTEGGAAKASQITASDIMPERRAFMEKTYGIDVTDDNINMVKKANVIILAVKPQVAGKVLKEAGPHMGKDKMLLSIVAGLPVSGIRRHLKEGTRIIRTMPNTPVFVGEGMVAIATGDTALAQDYEAAKAIFEPVAKTVMLEEKLIDAVLGISGSGPAYVFLMIEALADGGVKMGLPRDIAVTLAAQTLLGSAKMCLESGRHVGQLKDMVTSPGGTTIAALYAMEKAGIRAGLMEAVEAATLRSEELGKLS